MCACVRAGGRLVSFFPSLFVAREVRSASRPRRRSSRLDASPAAQAEKKAPQPRRSLSAAAADSSAAPGPAQSTDSPAETDAKRQKGEEGEGEKGGVE